MTSNEETFFNALLLRINQPELFSARNGIIVTEVRKDFASGELTVAPSSLNPRHIVHGGCLSTLMDTVAGIAACSTGRSCVTLNCTMNYIRAISTSKKAYCRAECVKTGRTICVVDCSVTDDDGKLITTGTYTYFLKEPLQEFLRTNEP